MTDERYKAIMAELGQPHSHSLLAALRQVANEVAQEVQAEERERCAKLCEQEHQESGEHPEMALHCAERIRGLRA